MFKLLGFLLILAVLSLFALPLVAQQVTPTPTLRAFTNFPVILPAESVSNATVNVYTPRSNAIPIVQGKDMRLAFEFTKATNAENATITHYFGLIYNGTNYSTQTNFTWQPVTGTPANTRQRVTTNIVDEILSGATHVFWWCTANPGTNSLTNTVLYGISP